ncbi:MAG: phage tail length tape measure family protein, partial [Oscillospiraceae bacterium]|nr:phage tail length tape measure family protein [Oscillospiraceae bacterium]
MSLLGNIWVKLGLRSDDFNKGMDKAHSRAEKFGTAIGKIGAKMVLAWAAVGVAVTRMFKASVDNYQQQEAANRKLQNALRNTGSAIGTNYDELKRYASELQRVNGFADDATMNAMATLTTFRSVQGDVFKATIKAAQDMAAFMGTDLNSAVQQLGKALEAPEVGLTMLRRSGVVFTKEMTDGIKAMVKEGKTYEAQLLILEEVNKRFGGAAAAQAETAAGQWQRVKNAFSDLTEYIGRSSEASRGLARGLAETLEFADRIISAKSLSAWQKFWAIINSGSKAATEALEAEDAERDRVAANVKRHTDTVMAGVRSVEDARAALAKQEQIYNEAQAKGWKDRAAESKGAVDALNAYITAADEQAEKDRQAAAAAAKEQAEWAKQHSGILNQLKDEIAAKEQLLNMANDHTEIARLQEELRLLKERQKYITDGISTATIGAVKAPGNGVAEATVPISIDTTPLQHSTDEVDDFIDKLKKQQEKVEDISNGFASALQNGMLDALDELAVAIGTGEWDTGAMLKALVTPLADMAISAGVIVSGLGEAIQAMKTSLTTLQGPVAIAAGAALIAAGVAAKAGLAAIARNGG